MLDDSSLDMAVGRKPYSVVIQLDLSHHDRYVAAPVWQFPVHWTHTSACPSLFIPTHHLRLEMLSSAEILEIRERQPRSVALNAVLNMEGIKAAVTRITGHQCHSLTKKAEGRDYCLSSVCEITCV